MGQPLRDFALLEAGLREGPTLRVPNGLASDAKATAGIRTPDLQFTKLPL